jgi:hypothetical protein
MPVKHAIAFGLNRLNPDAYGGFHGFLNGPAVDAVELARLAAFHGFTARAVFDAEATRQKFTDELLTMAESMHAGDTLLLSFSGHGGQVANPLEADGKSETLCLYDGQLLDSEIRSVFHVFAPGVRILWIVDACHSGGIDRSISLDRPKLLPVMFRGLQNYKKPEYPTADVKASVAVFGACEEGELAWDGGSIGNWTESLLSTLPSSVNSYYQRSAMQRLTYQDWFTAARQFCITKWARQHPRLRTIGAADILQIPVFS